MGNLIQTPLMLTRKALSILRNTNGLLRICDRQYDDRFANSGATMSGKIGPILNIRLPVEYGVRKGPTAVVQDTVQESVPLVVSKQYGVDMSFSYADLTLSIGDFGDNFIAPAVNTICAGVAEDLMEGAELIPNLVHNTDAQGATIPPDFDTWAAAGAVMDTIPVRRGGPKGRKIILDPITQARTVSTFRGLFNNQTKVGEQYTSGQMGPDVLGFDWIMDQTVRIHYTGNYGAPPTVSAPNVTGDLIPVSATAGPFNRGDIVSFAGVNRVNRVTKKDTGLLAQFALTRDVPAGSTALPIFPPLIPIGDYADLVDDGIEGAGRANVTNPPANGAQVTCATLPGEIYRFNIAMDPTSLTLASADLMLPRNNGVSHREVYDKTSMRVWSFSDGLTDQEITRLDVLFGYVWTRPYLNVRVADKY